tara:strand:+ start:1240 stop:1860 length:621 start_codon:yes stop_codon:yes gene_type:complete
MEFVMRILVACEYSGIVRDAFIARGQDAISCDILPTERPGPHHLGDVREILHDGWDMLIAFPPCTYISRAGARWLYSSPGVIDQSRFAKGMEAKAFFLELLNAPIPRICVENPTPLKAFDLPPYTQVVQPYQHGHEFSKRTLLWLKGLPELKPTKLMTEFGPYLPSNTGGSRRGQKFTYTKVMKPKDRSRTFQGIADAMASQWGTD